jgi:hypothetical protein
MLLRVEEKNTCERDIQIATTFELHKFATTDIDSATKPHHRCAGLSADSNLLVKHSEVH